MKRQILDFVALSIFATGLVLVMLGMATIGFSGIIEVFMSASAKWPSWSLGERALAVGVLSVLSGLFACMLSIIVTKFTTALMDEE